MQGEPPTISPRLPTRELLTSYRYVQTESPSGMSFVRDGDPIRFLTSSCFARSEASMRYSHCEGRHAPSTRQKSAVITRRLVGPDFCNLMDDQPPEAASSPHGLTPPGCAVGRDDGMGIESSKRLLRPVLDAAEPEGFVPV